MTKLTSLLASAAILGLTTVAAAQAAPAPPAPPLAPPLVVDVEVRDVGPTPAASRTITFALGLARVGDCAAAELDDGGRTYLVELCRPDVHGTLALDVSRQGRGAASVDVRKLRVTSRVAAGVRTVVARADQNPGGVEVALTVR